jgi:hypothetical protein
LGPAKTERVSSPQSRFNGEPTSLQWLESANVIEEDAIWDSEHLT